MENGMHLGGGGKRGGRIQGDGILHLDKLEHGQEVHSYLVSYGPM